MVKNKQLVKTKIVLEDNGKNIVVYFWKKTFWIFGYWYPYGSCSSSLDLTKKAKTINDDTVSKVLYNNFISGNNE